MYLELDALGDEILDDESLLDDAVSAPVGGLDDELQHPPSQVFAFITSFISSIATANNYFYKRVHN